MKYLLLVANFLVLASIGESAAIGEKFEKTIIAMSEEFEKILEDFLDLINYDGKGKDMMEDFEKIIGNLLSVIKNAEDLLAAVNNDGKGIVVMNEFEKIIEDLLAAIHNYGKGKFMMENVKKTKKDFIAAINEDGVEKITEDEFEKKIDDLVATIQISTDILHVIKSFMSAKGKVNKKASKNESEEFLVELPDGSFGIFLTPK